VFNKNLLSDLYSSQRRNVRNVRKILKASMSPSFGILSHNADISNLRTCHISNSPRFSSSDSASSFVDPTKFEIADSKSRKGCQEESDGTVMDRSTNFEDSATFPINSRSLSVTLDIQSREDAESAQFAFGTNSLTALLRDRACPVVGQSLEKVETRVAV